MRKLFSTTDLPDHVIKEATMLIVTGRIRPGDFESASRMVARAIMIERDEWLTFADRKSIERRFMAEAEEADIQ